MGHRLPKIRKLKCYRGSSRYLIFCSESESHAPPPCEVTGAGRKTWLCMDMDGHFGNISFHHGINAMQYDICNPRDQTINGLLEIAC